MKILRIKRGYTTNSSSGNEWVPEAGVKVRTQFDAGPPREFGVLDHTSKHIGVKSKTPAKKKGVTWSKEGANPWAAAAADEGEASNLGLVLILAVVVCLIFVVGDLIRRRR